MSDQIAAAVNVAWDRIEDWLARRAPEALTVLSDGATTAAVVDVERTLDVRFPAALRASFLRHDGQRFRQPFLFGGGRLLPLEDVVSEWSMAIELSSGDDPTLHWNPTWIPFVGRDGDNLHVRSDLVDGNLVWTFEHEAEGMLCTDAPFEAWLLLWLDDLVAGRLSLGDGTFDISETARSWPSVPFARDDFGQGQSPVQ